MKRYTIAAALLVACAAGRAMPVGVAAQQRGRKETLTSEQKQRLKQNLERAIRERQAAEKQMIERLDASRQRFLASERQKVEAENASMRVRIAAHQGPQAEARIEAIEREARELSQRAAGASAAERAAIDRRAAELLRELRAAGAPVRKR